MILVGRRLDDVELERLDKMQDQGASVQTAAQVFLKRQLGWAEIERAKRIVDQQ